MNPLKRFPIRFFHSKILVLVLAGVVSGCSGSGDPQSTETPSLTESAAPLVDNDTDNDPQNSSSDVAVNDTSTDVVSDENDNSAPIEPDNSSPDPAQPIPENTVLVNFEITVPAYQSNELSVELVSGDLTFFAMWIGDEYWSATAEFPAQTEHTLSVTFYDRNGEIALASLSQEFITGSDVMEATQISADRFDADQFDMDGDGVNNLDELISGTDPSVDEDSLLEILDVFNLSEWSRMSVSHHFEARLSEERPHFSSFELVPDFPHYTSYEWLSVSGDVDIDANGNGTLGYSFYHPVDQVSLRGTRTRSGDSISWEGSRSAYDGDYGHGVEFTNTVTVIDESTRDFFEEIVGSNIGTYDYRWEVSSSLTGRLVEGTSLCKPVAGTISATYRTNPGESVTVTTISKEIEDPYWRMVRTSGSGQTAEYFVREIKMNNAYSVAERAAGTVDLAEEFFICDFVDI